MKKKQNANLKLRPHVSNWYFLSIEAKRVECLVEISIKDFTSII